jgi:hypothetical protein
MHRDTAIFANSPIGRTKPCPAPHDGSSTASPAGDFLLAAVSRRS